MYILIIVMHAIFITCQYIDYILMYHSCVDVHANCRYTQTPLC